MEGLDKIFVINLPRRFDRRRICQQRLESSGLSADILSKVEFIDAVDGRELDQGFVDTLGIKAWPDWKIPGHKMSFYRRELKWGEIGCALSHLLVWQRVVEQGLSQVLVFEDDVIFAENFAAGMTQALSWLRAHKPGWELLYAGRQPVLSDREKLTDFLVKPGYSYCAHAYAITQSCARKFLGMCYHESIIAVDEFIPAMYRQHPRSDVAQRFYLHAPVDAYAMTPSMVLQANMKDSDTEESSSSVHEIAAVA